MSSVYDIPIYSGFMEVTLTFGEWLSDTLKEANISQTRLAEIIGTSQGTVSGWVNDDARPTRRNCRAIADALKLDRKVVLQRAGYKLQPPAQLQVLVDRDLIRVSDIEGNTALEIIDDVSDPLVSAALANQDKLTPAQKRLAARLIEALVEEARDAGHDIE